MAGTKRPLVAIYFQMFSPYIVARLNAAADRMAVTGIEGSRRSSAYAWEPREGADRFRRVTLFHDRAVEEVSPAEASAAMRAALDAIDPDVVMVPGWSQSEAVTMLVWARERGRRAVVMSESTPDDSPRTRLREAIKRWVVGHFDSALVGGSPQRDYARTLGMPADRIFLGYDSIDNAYFAEGAAAVRADPEPHRAELELPAKYFLASSRFIEKKNLARLLDAFSRYRAQAGDDPWDLVLVGDGELRSALEGQAARLGLASAVHFAGFRQYEALPAYYALAGAFVHVSTVEQWGLVVNEAMAAGLPVIVSTRCGCARDLVIDGENGWSVDPLSTQDIADKLALVADPACDRAAMGRSSARIVAAFAPERFGEGAASAVACAIERSPRTAGSAARALLKFIAARGGRAGG